MQASIRHQFNQLNFSKAEAQQFWKHMHFATASVAEVGHWIPGLLRQWTSPRKVISVTSQQGTPEMPVQKIPSCSCMYLAHLELESVLIIIYF